jgi:hypothetical protein
MPSSITNEAVSAARKSQNDVRVREIMEVPSCLSTAAMPYYRISNLANQTEYCLGEAAPRNNPSNDKK